MVEIKFNFAKIFIKTTLPKLTNFKSLQANKKIFRFRKAARAS